MYKSTMVKLVLLNSTLILAAGCARDPDDPEKKGQSGSSGGGHGHYVGHYYRPWGAAPGITPPVPTAGRPGPSGRPPASSGAVGRGGFGSTGHASS